jgi:DNA replication protein DnaC
MENFRFRTATYWTDEEKDRARKKFATEYRESTSIFDNVEKEKVENEKRSINQNGIKFGSRDIKDGVGEFQFESRQRRVLCGLFSSNTVSSANDTTTGDLHEEHPSRVHYEMNQTRIEDLCTAVEKDKFVFCRPASDTDMGKRDLRRNRDGSYLNVEEVARQYIEARDLSRRQYIIASKVFDYFKKVRKYKARVKRQVSFYELQNNGIIPPRLIVTGDPGTGKSYLIETICEIASITKVGFVGTTSYNGIAAVNIDGNTISSMFSLHDDNNKKLNEDDQERLQNLRQSLNSDDMCFLIVDEVSTIDCRLIAMLHIRCQQIFDNDLDFGGIPLLFTGDFNQLGPVKKTFIPKDMMTWAKRLRQLNRLHDPPPPSDQHQNPPTFGSKPNFSEGSIPSAAKKQGNKSCRNLQLQDSSLNISHTMAVIYCGSSYVTISMNKRDLLVIQYTLHLYRISPKENQSIYKIYLPINHLLPKRHIQMNGNGLQYWYQTTDSA